MKRTSAVIGESLENIGYTFIAAAMLASTALAFVGSPLAPSLPRPAEILGVRLEGVVVTPRRTYSASEWAKRPAAVRRVASIELPAAARQCRLIETPQVSTQLC